MPNPRIQKLLRKLNKSRDFELFEREYGSVNV